MIIQQCLDVIPEVIRRQALLLFAPMRQPTSVDLTAENQSALEVLGSH